MDVEVRNKKDPIPVCGECSGTMSCKVLPCQHVYCEDCLEKHVLEQEDDTYVVGCPYCHFPVVLADDRLAGLPTIQASATPVDSKQQTSKPSTALKPLTCTKHSRKLQLYCQTCLGIICNQCAIDEHQEHQYHTITNSHLNKYRQEMSKLLDDMANDAKNVEDKLIGLDRREREIKEQNIAIEEEIRSLAERLVELICKSEADLYGQLENVTEQKLKMLSLQREEGKRVLEQLKASSKQIQNSLSTTDESSSYQLLTSRKELLESAQNATNLVRSIHLVPIEKADLKFDGNGSLLVLNKDMGRIQHTFINHYCRPVISKGSVARANTNNTLQFILTDGDDPLSIPISLFDCHISGSDKKTITHCTISESQDGLYEINFIPTTDGVHQLSIQIGGQHIPNSPFNIAISPSLATQEGQTLRIIPNLQHPWGIGVMKSNEDTLIVVAETASHCLTLLREDGKKVATIGHKGKEDGAFTDPKGVAITSNNHILVTDYNRIQKLTTSGHCVRSICGKGSGPLQFKDPKGLCVNPQNGKIFIADSNNHRIQVLNSDFSFSHSFQEEELQFPWDVTCDLEGEHVYVVDNNDHSIRKFTSQGEPVMKFGSKGTEPSQLNWPSAITCGRDGNLYISDDNDFITVFDPQGNYIRRIGNDANGKSIFKHPLGIAIDDIGRLYISDCWNDRLVIV
jgi:DNA-binding beta-propeller fold protein YncE